jgi:hypothetical protein
MKLGPCLRNSVVSPKSGHPIVPGGRPRRRLYRTSFHRSRRPLATTSTRTAPSNARSSAISVFRLDEDGASGGGGASRRQYRGEARLCCWVGRRGPPYIGGSSQHTTPHPYFVFNLVGQKRYYCSTGTGINYCIS